MLSLSAREKTDIAKFAAPDVPPNVNSGRDPRIAAHKIVLLAWDLETRLAEIAVLRQEVVETVKPLATNLHGLNPEDAATRDFIHSIPGFLPASPADLTETLEPDWRLTLSVIAAFTPKNALLVTRHSGMHAALLEADLLHPLPEGVAEKLTGWPEEDCSRMLRAKVPLWKVLGRPRELANAPWLLETPEIIVCPAKGDCDNDRTKHGTAMKPGSSVPKKPENKPFKGLDGFVLDCDGVLFDSKEANTAYFNHIRFAVKLPPMTAEEAAYSHMASTDEALERMIPQELQAEARRAKLSTKYRDIFMDMMRPSPYMYSFLREMKKAGLRLALCTNRSDSVHHVLNHFDIGHYFSPVMTISQVQPKPSPQGLLEIVKAWDATPESIIFLGDSLVDQQAAVAASVPFWSFDNPRLAAEVHVSDFKQLGEILLLMLMRDCSPGRG